MRGSRPGRAYQWRDAALLASRACAGQTVRDRGTCLIMKLHSYIDMSRCIIDIPAMIADQPSLADLATASGIEARTIRSWVAQGLLPAPLTRGPAARYPSDTLERLLAVRTMRDVLGMPLAEIRKELLVASTDQIRAYANRQQSAALADVSYSMSVEKPASSAADYIGALRARALPSAVSAPAPAPALALSTSAMAPSAQGFAALEQRLGQGRGEPARKARAEVWLRIPITPDIELAVCGELDVEQRVRLERCADLIRDILLGRDS